MRIVHCVIVLSCVVTLVACSSKKEHSGKYIPPAETGISSGDPIFYGVQCIATAGSTTARLDWAPGMDDATPADQLRYQVFVSDAEFTDTFDFSSPALTTAPADAIAKARLTEAI